MTYGPTPLRSHADVAQVALGAVGLMSAAVAARFGVTADKARAMICRARQAGYEIPYTPTPTKHDRAEIARVASAAAVNQMGAAVQHHFGVSRTHANRMIELARKAGHSIPYANRAAPTIKVVDRFDGVVLACVCGWSCPVTAGALGLAAHTRSEHRRVPSRSERVPQDGRKVAA